MTEDWEQDAGWQEFVKRVREDALQKIMGSAVVMSIVPTGEPDIKYAVELGLGIMLDKPLVLVVMPGTGIPERLRRVADKIVYADVDTEEGRELLAASMVTVMNGLPRG